MKLKKILPHLDKMAKVEVYIIDSDDEPSCEFSGSILDVPWGLLDMELSTDINGEAISICNEGFTIALSGR